jgi:hypothetical protein
MKHISSVRKDVSDASRLNTISIGAQGTISIDHDHSVCQKLKAENECFVQSCRSRFWNNSLKHWKLSETLKTQILEIIELLITETPRSSETERTSDLQSFAPKRSVQNEALERSSKDLSSCIQIKSLNEFHKLQFFKASFLLETLEKSKLSPIHLHRISIFLQTKLFSDLPIKDFFEEMMSVSPLYECKSCKLHAPIDADLSEVTKYFYTSVRHLCKACFKNSMKENYKTSSLKSTKGSQSNDFVPGTEADQSLKPLTKMYLCMKCGEDNYVNFYERNKSKCKFCILSEKRGIDGTPDGYYMAPSASKDHHCKHCHTEDPKNFRETYKSICYACFLLEKKAKYALDPQHQNSVETSYFCKDCESTVPSRFRRGYKSQCYECFLYEKKKSLPVERSSELLSKDSKPLESQTLGPDLRCICKYCNDNDNRNFNEGMSSVCARCEPLDSETFICKSCSLECLRNCFTPLELSKPPGERLCNLCDPVALAALASERKRKEFKCNNCEESRPEEFYSGFKGKCKACVRSDRKEGYRASSEAQAGGHRMGVQGTQSLDNEYIRKPKPTKDYDCMGCGTNIPSEFYLGHKSKCKHCI